jgi:hypothetical protein
VKRSASQSKSDETNVDHKSLLEAIMKASKRITRALRAAE